MTYEQQNAIITLFTLPTSLTCSKTMKNLVEFLISLRYLPSPLQC